MTIFLGMAPSAWHGKKQGSIESSSFGSELSAMKTAVEMIEGLCYKLRMMGIPLDGKTFVKADNMSVIHNCSNCWNIQLSLDCSYFISRATVPSSVKRARAVMGASPHWQFIY